MKHILVVDDNLATLRFISAQVDGRYKVSLAKDSAQAFAIAALQMPDLILLDVEMPGMSGFEVIARLKENSALAGIPVIFLTAHGDAEVEVRALEAGAVDFLSKPVEKDILLHRIDLHLQFFQYQRHLEKAVLELEDSIVSSFADLIDYAGRDYGGHEKGIDRYLSILCQALREESAFAECLGARAVEEMLRAAPLHDVGKIGISDLVLLREGPLTAAEYDNVKQHTLIGANFLQHIWERTPSLGYLRYAREMAEGHHERYDGTGYPHGLRADAIPPSCRILSVANVYASLVKDCVYRKALSHEEACRIILEGRGTEFDPRVVDAFSARKDAFAEEAQTLVVPRFRVPEYHARAL